MSILKRIKEIFIPSPEAAAKEQQAARDHLVSYANSWKERLHTAHQAMYSIDGGMAVAGELACRALNELPQGGVPEVSAARAEAGAILSGLPGMVKQHLPLPQLHAGAAMQRLSEAVTLAEQGRTEEAAGVVAEVGHYRIVGSDQAVAAVSAMGATILLASALGSGDVGDLQQ